LNGWHITVTNEETGRLKFARSRVEQWGACAAPGGRRMRNGVLPHATTVSARDWRWEMRVAQAS
jgi:hypothetical protein